MNNNINFLNQLIKIEEKIYMIYMYFAHLEKNNKKDGQYISKLNELDGLYITERNFLKNLPDDDIQLIQMILLIESSMCSENDLVFSIDDAKLSVVDRILCQIEDYQSYLEVKKINAYIEDEYEEDGVEIIDIENEVKNYYNMEFFVRLQKRIDNFTKDRDRLIDEKYKMVFSMPVLDNDVLCTGFNFKDLPKVNFKLASEIVGVSQDDYEMEYFKYVSELIELLITDMVWLEQNEHDKTEKRIACEIADMQLEIALKSFDFIMLYELKEKILEVLEQQGMKQSLTYIIVSENLNEAINYACNNPYKLSIKPLVKFTKRQI